MTAFMAGLGVTALVMLWWPSRPGHRLLRPVRVESSVPQLPRLARRLRVALAAGCALTVWLLIPATAGVMLSALSAVVAYVLAGRLVAPEVERCRSALAREHASTLWLLANTLEVGVPLSRATQQVAEVSAEQTRLLLEKVAAHVQVGRGDDLAWRSVLDDPVVAPIWGRTAKDLARNARSGAAVVHILRDHAREADDAHRARIEKKARTVGVRSVLPMMVCFLPAFILVGVVPIIAGLIGSLGW